VISSSGKRYFVGLDLGMGAEPTALAVLERRMVEPTDRPGQRQPPYALRHLRRFPPATSYPAIVDDVGELLQTPPMPGAWLLVDYTGVGLAVLRLLVQGLHRRVSYSFTAMLLSAGHDESNPATGMVVVAKTDLIGTLQVLLQARRLHIAAELPDARHLVRELENYRPKVMLPTSELLQWRDGKHDDLLLAVALAAWGGERALLTEGRRERRTVYR
jgi:hypothetical protein